MWYCIVYVIIELVDVVSEKNLCVESTTTYDIIGNILGTELYDALFTVQLTRKLYILIRDN